MTKCYITLFLLCINLLSGCSPMPSPVTQPTTTPQQAHSTDNHQYSLNTYVWDYAPWLREFGQNLRKHWDAPSDYKRGEIPGDILLQVTVEKTGIFSEIKTISNTGHQSLVKASIQALEKISPASPLPANFPKDNLVITLELHYPPMTN